METATQDQPKQADSLEEMQAKLLQLLPWNKVVVKNLASFQRLIKYPEWELLKVFLNELFDRDMKMLLQGRTQGGQDISDLYRGHATAIQELMTFELQIAAEVAKGGR